MSEAGTGVDWRKALNVEQGVEVLAPCPCRVLYLRAIGSRSCSGAAPLGIAAYAVVQAACAGEAARLRGLRGRFSASVFPGETIRTELWNELYRMRLRCVAVERNVVVLDRGTAVLASEEQRRPL